MKTKELLNLHTDLLFNNIHNLTNKQLKSICKLSGIPSSGNKSILIENISKKYTDEKEILYSLLKKLTLINEIDNIFYESVSNQYNTIPSEKYTSLKEIEELENKYLEIYYYFLKYVELDILKGLNSKEKIRDQWKQYWGSNEQGISEFSTGAERIIYSLINGKGIGSSNSNPVASDLFFEVDDAFIHIDLKTITTQNIGDYVKDIPVGNNQNSYYGNIQVEKRERKIKGKKEFETREYHGNLPTEYRFHEKGDLVSKPCLTYFITILVDSQNYNVININLLCMPNGKLNCIYQDSILKAGKVKKDPATEINPYTIRYKWAEAINFATLENKNRIKVIYLNDSNDEDTVKKLNLIYNIANTQ